MFLIFIDQACFCYKWKYIPKGIVSLHWSGHIGDVPSPHCSFPLCGKLNYCLFLNFTITVILLFYALKIIILGKIPCPNVLRAQVMAGSGHLQTFRLLRFLRSRNPADGHANYGIQMAVSFVLYIRSHIASRDCIFIVLPYSVSSHPWIDLSWACHDTSKRCWKTSKILWIRKILLMHYTNFKTSANKRVTRKQKG